MQGREKGKHGQLGHIKIHLVTEKGEKKRERKNSGYRYEGEKEEKKKLKRLQASPASPKRKGKERERNTNCPFLSRRRKKKSGETYPHRSHHWLTIPRSGEEGKKEKEGSKSF